MVVPPGTIIEAFYVIEHIRLCVNAGSKTAAGKCNKAKQYGYQYYNFGSLERP